MNSWFTTIDKYHLTKSIAYQHNFRPYIDGYNNFIYVQNYPLLQGKDFVIILLLKLLQDLY